MSLSRQKITLLGIFALFIGPVILVMLMRSSWWQYQPASLKNQGHLVQPPVYLALNKTQGNDRRWLILHVLDQPCGKACIEHVTALRQIHRAAGRNREHLAVVLLDKTDAEPGLWPRLESIYPEFELLADPAATALKTLATINAKVAKSTGHSDSIHTYILDPMLNVILAYGVNSGPNGIHKDLKRLMRWSDQENRR